ncbi:hypothetical protein V8F20_012248 [Naviculisporaceae sp. PSN 640]
MRGTVHDMFMILLWLRGSLQVESRCQHALEERTKPSLHHRGRSLLFTIALASRRQRPEEEKASRDVYNTVICYILSLWP